MPGTVERETCPRAGLVEGVDQDLAGERRVVPAVTIRVALEFGRQSKQLQQGFRPERLNRHHVLVDQIQQRLTVFSDGRQQLLRLIVAEHIGPHRLEAERRRSLLDRGCVGLGHRHLHQHPTCQIAWSALNHIFPR